MKRTNAKNRREAAGRPGTRFASAVLSVLAFLIFSALLAAPALARPCCSTCDGPEPYDDPACWSVCIPCQGPECSSDGDCASPSRCRDGYCTNDPFGDQPGDGIGNYTAESFVDQPVSSSAVAGELSELQTGVSDCSTSAAELSESECFVEDVAADGLAQEH